MEHFRRYLARLKEFLRRRGRTDADAEDLIQEAFLRLEVYSRRHEVLEPEAFLVRTVANLSTDKYRHDGVLEVLDTPVEDLEILDTSPRPDEICAAREGLFRLVAGLEALSPQTREALLAHRYDGLSCPQIAKQQGVSVSTVEKRLARAVLQLMEWMEDRD